MSHEVFRSWGEPNMIGKKFEKGTTLFVLLILLSLPAIAVVIQPVQAQGEQLVLLMPTTSKYLDPYIDRFKDWYLERTGKTIEVKHVRMGGVECIERVREQGGNPTEDVVASIGYDGIELLRREDYLEPYFGPNTEYIPETVFGTLVGKNPEGYYTGFSVSAYGIMVNKEALQSEGLPTPTGYTDLALTTDYYGHIVMGSPILSRIAHGNMDVVLAHFGWVQGWNMSIRLASLVDRFTITTGEANKLTADGEYAVTLTKYSYWYEYAEAGYPVEWIWPVEGTNIYVLYNAVLRGAKNTENAKLWIDWMLSAEGQRAWVDCRYETVIRPDIDLPVGMPSVEELGAVAKVEPNYDENTVTERYDVVTKLWTERLVGYHGVLQKEYDDPEALNGHLDDWIVEPIRAAEDMLATAQDTVAEAKAMSLTEKGQYFLERAEAHLAEARVMYNVSFDHEEAYNLAKEATKFAEIAKGYKTQPPVWPYYLMIGLTAIVASGSGYLLFKRRYRKTIEELFKKLKDRLDVDQDGRLLLVSDVMKVPMILTTRDYIIQIQKMCERTVGKEKMKKVMFQSGFEGGHDFASSLAAMSGLKGEQILEEYLRVASVRGWGRFEVIKADASSGIFVVRIHSSFVEEFRLGKGKVCHIWRGFIAGVVQAILESLEKVGTLKSEETECMANGDPYCEIRVKVTFQEA